MGKKLLYAGNLGYVVNGADLDGLKWQPKKVGSAGFDTVRMVLAAILLVAAALKAYQLATGPVANKDILSYRWSLMFQVEFEIGMGLWLVSGLYKRLAWAAATTCFSFFSCITLYKALSGEASCGCFGYVEVNPRYTLVLDISAVAALLVFRPPLLLKQAVLHYRYRLLAAGAAAIGLGLWAGIAMGSFRPAQIAQDGTIVGTGGPVVLEPKEWIGNRFPLFGQIDVGPRLAKGTWVVFFHRHGCTGCARAMPGYLKMAEGLAGKASSASLALIELPPYGQSPQQGTSGGAYLRGRLRDTHEWFVQTPAVVLLEDGKVTAAWEGQAPRPEYVLSAVPAGQVMFREKS